MNAMIKLPFPAFAITVDRATALSLATYSHCDSAQYAAGLLMRLCATAAALHVRPEEVISLAVEQAMRSIGASK